MTTQVSTGAQLKELSLSELRRLNNANELTSIYVLNHVDINNRRPSGQVLLTVARENGHTSIITIPETWIPIDISAQAPINMILESTDFTRLVHSKILRVISEEAAEQILKMKEAQEEAARIAFLPTVEEAMAEAEATANVQSNVTGRVLNIVENPDMTIPQKITALRAIEKIFTDDDVAYLLKAPPAIRDWITERTSK